MSWWRKEKTVVAEMPNGYKFEFETTAVNVVSRLSSSAHLAKFHWFLFHNLELIDDGDHQIYMDSPHPEVEMFMYGRRKALDHAKKVLDANTFLFANMNVVHELPDTMVMSEGLYKTYSR